MPDDAKSAVSVDELLDAQSEPSTRAPLARVAGDDAAVEVTPWVPGQGCMCHAALVVRKDQIASVTPTGETHLCCGEQHHVVTVQFADETLAQVFGQLVQNAAVPTHAAPTAPPVAAMPAPGVPLRAPVNDPQATWGTARQTGALFRRSAERRPWDPRPWDPLQECRDSYETCLGSYIPGWTDPAYVQCACRNAYCMCSGTCSIQMCLESGMAF